MRISEQMMIAVLIGSLSLRDYGSIHPSVDAYQAEMSPAILLIYVLDFRLTNLTK